MNEKYLFNYFVKEVLEITNETEEQLINFKTRYEDEDEDEDENENENEHIFTNYTIISYYDNKNIIRKEIKTNTFFLINEYENLHNKYEKYNKIPNYINKETKYIEIKCRLEKINQSYYQNIKNIPFILFENNKYILSEFLKYNDYNHRLPIIFINANFHKKFIGFLKKHQKYQYYKNYNIYYSYLILPWKSIHFEHTILSRNLILATEVVENIDFYNNETVNKIISEIKTISQKDYRSEINDWIIIVFDILVEWILFVLNKEPLYYTCTFCNNPLIFIKDNESENIIIDNERNFYSENNIIISNNDYINNDPFDISFFKSINICNNIYKIIINKYDKYLMNDYIRINDLDNKEKIELKNNDKIVADPPKIEKYINIIYHDGNYNNNEYCQSINKDIFEFKKHIKGTFIFSSSFKTFEIIVEGINKNIKNKNDDTKFFLINNGKSFQTIIDFITDKNITFIKGICIYCKIRKNYEHLLNQYNNILQEIYISVNGVISFIERNSSVEKNIYQSLKLIEYNSYKSEYYKLHQIISKYYKKSSNNSYYQAIDILKSFMKTNNKPELFKGLQKFEHNLNYEIIREYTDNTIYGDINSWLLNLDELAYDKSGYFIGQLMYKLNEYGKNERNINLNQSVLFRGMYIDYLDALSYEIHLGKIICFQTFLSTSLDENIAKGFAKFRLKPEERKRDNINVFIRINQNLNNISYPICFDISKIAEKDIDMKKNVYIILFPFLN